MRIDSLEVSREIVQRFTKDRHIPDVFLETKFPERNPEERDSTFVKRVVSSIRRLIRNHIPEEASKRVAYIAEILDLDPSDVEWRLHDEHSVTDRLLSVTTKREASSPHMVLRLPYPVEQDSYSHLHLHLYRRMKPAYHRTVRGFRHVGDSYTPIADLESYLAEQSLLNALDKYVKADPNRLMTALFDYLYQDGQLDLRRVAKPVADKLRELAPKYGVERIKEGDNKNVWFASYVDESFDVFAQGTFRNPFQQLTPLIISFVGQVVDVRNLVKDASNEKANYAKAFQTKKHIPKTHLKKMEDNRFLDIYGYVELDEDVDLERFEEIERQFTEFSRLAGMSEAKDHDFRIKRLGNYRAAGVYFPFFKSTIFDIRHPDAFGHEWMHQIDYTFRGDGRNVHEESRFHPLYVRYMEEVERAIAEAGDDNPLKKSWKGSTKYNRGYYSKKTEVFARLGEIYLSTFIDDNNSLIKKKEELEASPVYPTDDMTVRLVVSYFDELFGRGRLEKEQKIS